MQSKKYVLILIIIYMIIGFGLTSATSFYTWSGSLKVGDVVYINNIKLTIDQDNKTGELALILPQGVLFDGQNTSINGLSISFAAFNDYGVVSISSEKPFTLSFAKEDYIEKLKQFEEENAALKAQNANLSQKIRLLQMQVQKLKEENEKLKKPGQSATNVEQLNAKIVNLTKQNRALKAELANLTNKYNALKAKADFLSQQNGEYRTMIQNLLKETAQGSEREYVEQAKKEKLIGSVLIKAIVAALVVVGLIGYGLYRAKRRHDFAGL